MHWNSFEVFVGPIQKYQVDSEWGELLFLFHCENGSENWSVLT